MLQLREFMFPCT